MKIANEEQENCEEDKYQGNEGDDHSRIVMDDWTKYAKGLLVGYSVHKDKELKAE